MQRMPIYPDDYIAELLATVSVPHYHTLSMVRDANPPGPGCKLRMTIQARHQSFVHSFGTVLMPAYFWI